MIKEHNESLIESFMLYDKHIRQMAHKLAKQAKYTEEEDLYQIGCLTFIMRYKKYNSSLNKTLWGYSWSYIFSAMVNYLKQNDGLIHIPLGSSTQVNYIYENISEYKDGKKLFDDEAQMALEQILYDSSYKIINEIMDICLTEREKKVICLRFGFEDGDKKTLEQTAKYLGYATREGIRKIEIRALEKLTSYCEQYNLTQDILN